MCESRSEPNYDYSDIGHLRDAGNAQIRTWIEREDQEKDPHLAIRLWYKDQKRKGKTLKGTVKIPLLLQRKYGLLSQDVRQRDNKLIAVHGTTEMEVLIHDCEAALELEPVAA